LALPNIWVYPSSKASGRTPWSGGGGLASPPRAHSASSRTTASDDRCGSGGGDEAMDAITLTDPERALLSLPASDGLLPQPGAWRCQWGAGFIAMDLGLCLASAFPVSLPAFSSSGRAPRERCADVS